MNKFAKIYESEKLGQILIINEDNEGDPCITIKFQCRGIGVSEVSFKFNDSEEGCIECDTMFDYIDLEKSEIIVGDIVGRLIDSGISHEK